MPSPFYRHSGKVPPVALVVAPVISFGIAAIAGGAFGYFELLAHLLPAAKMLVIAIAVGVVLLGVLLGSVPVASFKRLKARSTPALLLLTFLQGVVALYFAWVFWVVAYFNYTHLPVRPIVGSPRVLWNLIRLFDGHGVWTMGFVGHPVGPALAGIWIAEALIILGLPLAMAYKQASARVFCEHCHRWGVLRQLMQISSLDSKRLRTTILEGDFGLLRSADPSPSGEDCWNDIVLEGCNTCDNLQTLTVIRSMRLRSNGKTELKRDRIIYRMLVSPEQTADLVQIAAIVKAKEESPPTSD